MPENGELPLPSVIDTGETSSNGDKIATAAESCQDRDGLTSTAAAAITGGPHVTLDTSNQLSARMEIVDSDCNDSAQSLRVPRRTSVPESLPVRYRRRDTEVDGESERATLLTIPETGLRSLVDAAKSPPLLPLGIMATAVQEDDSAVLLQQTVPVLSDPKVYTFTPAQQRRRLAEAVLCLIGVAVTWVGAAELVQYLFESEELLPFFLTYLCVSEFVVLLPVCWVAEWWRAKSALSSVSPSEDGRRVSNWRGAARAAAIVCPVWFLAQATYNWSLAGTSVSSSTVLSTTSCVWTFILGVAVFKQERFAWAKVVGVMLTVAGGVLVSYGDGEPRDDGGGGGALWADALCLFSAFCYGCYTALIKRVLPSDGSVSSAVFFGWLGLFTSLLLLPVVLALDAANIERLAYVTPAFVGWSLVKGLFDNVLSDLMWARAIQLSSATHATVGLALTIPLAMLADLALRGIAPGLWLLLGSLGVVGGFLVATLSAADDVVVEVVDETDQSPVLAPVVVAPT